MTTILLLLILMAGSAAFKQGLFSSHTAGSTADVQQNARASLNLILRDFMVSGADLTIGGIPVPTAFLQSQILFPVVPQRGQGPTINGRVTDRVIIAFSDITYTNLALDKPPEYCINNIATSGAFVTLDIINCQDAMSIKPGDILLIKNNTGSLSALGYVTSRPANNRVEFSAGDPLRLNAPGPDSPVGRLNCQNQGQGQGCRDSAVAFKINIVYYFIDNSSPDGPILMRQRNGENPTLVSFGIEDFQITYTLADGTTTGNPANPLDIRKANVFMLARSKERDSQDHAFYRFPLEGQVTTKNLAYAVNN